jgi:RNA polymerase sigma factor (sigma-70 family)
MNNHERYLAIIRGVDQELGWRLDQHEQERYATDIQPYIPANCTQDQLRKIVTNYHADHTLVEALRDRRHQRYEAEWMSWVAQVLPILRRAGLDWSSDLLFDDEDLAQIARTELVRAINSFHYASRLSTWAHQVIVQSVRRAIRDRQALKRAIRPDSLEQIRHVDASIGDAEHPESAAAARVLVERIAAVLEERADRRLAHMFHLWVVADLRIEEIGKIVHLHPSRVRALLLQARQILCDAPEIQSWREDMEDRDRAHEAG